METEVKTGSVVGEASSGDRLWSPKEVAAFLGVSRNWVYGQVARRSIPHHYVGNQLRFVPSEIRAHFLGTSEPHRVVTLDEARLTRK